MTRHDPALSSPAGATLALALGWALAFHPTAAVAQAAVTFPITGFEVTGDNPLPAQTTQQLLQPFVRADATLETLQKAAAALEAALRQRGFALYRVVLPPQQVSGQVALNLVKFTVDTVTVQGQRQFDEANVRRSLPELQEGRSPNFKHMAVQTAIANENQGKQIQVAMKESTKPDHIDVNVIVKESKPWQGSVSLNNTGNAATGRDRVTVALGHANVFNLDHQLSAAYTTSLEEVSKVKQVGVSYRVPLYAQRSVIGVNYTQSDVVGSFGTFNSTGAGQTFGVNVSHYFSPQQGYRSYVTASIDDKQFDVTQINGTPLVGQQLRRSRQLSLGYTGRYESDAAHWHYSTELATNLPGGAGNNLAAYQSEDPRISSARWTALRANGSFTAGFAGNWLWNLRGGLQHSPRALIAGEQFGLGGMGSVRGTSERPVSGDRGANVTMEVSSPELLAGMRVLGFLDAGWLSNQNPNGANKPNNDQLRSVGLGLRYGTPRLALSADYGRLVTGSVVPLSANSAAPQKGDHKLHVNLVARF